MRFTHDRLMIGKATSTDRATLVSFGRQDFSRLISWLPTEADLIEWCAAFFKYPLAQCLTMPAIFLAPAPRVCLHGSEPPKGCW